MKRIRMLLFLIVALGIIMLFHTSIAETLTLPADLTAVEDEAFFGDESLETVVLPEHIKTIGSKAFAGSGVTAVNLPDSLTFIADDAFDDTTVTTLTVNEGTYAYIWAVNHGYFGWEYSELLDGTVEITGYTESQGTVTIPRQIGGKQVSGIADGAFAGNDVLVSVTVPGTVTRIGEEAFAGSARLTSVTVGNGVKVIGFQAFCDCPFLSTVTLPESGVSLGTRLFRYCKSLESANLPSGISEVPYQIFWDCESLQRIDIPDGVTSISDGAFYKCESLTEVTVPDSLVSIGDKAFFSCASLESLTLPASVTNIHELAFSGCEFLVLNAPEGSVAWQYAQDHQLVPEDVVLESEHPFTQPATYSYDYPGEASALRVTFSGHTNIYDDFGLSCLIITDAEGRETEYHGSALAGKTLVLPGTHFGILLDTYLPTSSFGFRITAVEPMDADEYAAYLAELAENPFTTAVVNGTLEITGYRGFETEVVVPARINGIAVAAVGEGAFRGKQEPDARSGWGRHPADRHRCLQRMPGA